MMTLRNGFAQTLLILAIVLPAASSGRPACADLIGLWRFEGNLLDTTINKFHGTFGTLASSTFTPGGSPSFSSDTPFAGSSQSLDMSINTSASPQFAISLGNDSGLNPTDEMTLAAWFRTPPTSGPQAFVDRSDGTNSDRAYSFHINSQTANGSLASNWTRTSLTPHANVNTDFDGSGADFNDDTWHHVAVTLNSESNGGDGLLRMYVDGALEATAPAGEEIFSIHTNSLNTYIGAFGDGSVFEETLLDDVALFDTALTLSEINLVRNGNFFRFLPVPEPSTFTLAMVGLVPLVRRRRRLAGGKRA